jgi:N-acetylneuraminic acid mutarotase
VRWAAGEPLPGPARDHHMTFVTTQGGTARLHVVGGTNYEQVFADHWISTIAADGTLGPWRRSLALPEARAGAAVGRWNDEVYVIGGQSAGAFPPTVWRARFDQRGAIAEWAAQPDLPGGRFHASVATWGDRLYVSGGVVASGVAQDSLFVGDLDAHGEVTGWRTFHLPAPRSHHSSFAHDGWLYLAFGFSGNPFADDTQPHPDVVRARLADDGMPGDWETVVDEGTTDLATAAGTVVGDCAYVIAGLQNVGGDYSYRPDVRRLDLATGAFAPLDAASALLLGRSHMHQVPFYAGHFYAAGGSRAYQDVVTEVEIGTPAWP